VSNVGWIPLGDEAHGLVVEGRIVALTYAYSVGVVLSSEAFEFWWAPVDDPDSGDVLFGVGRATGDAWMMRWEHAKNVTELLYGEWRSRTSPSTKTASRPEVWGPILAKRTN
jgi:hypothetical protein